MDCTTALIITAVAGVVFTAASVYAAPAADHSVAPRQKTKTDLAPGSPGKRLEAHTGDTQTTFLQQPGQDKSVESSIASQPMVLAANSSPITAECAANNNGEVGQ
ncbi:MULTISPECIES: hypothetical protein [Cupriavidus]|jgi:hypothetical protein|uniref:hypothetical protein n=1 Tax=Cupriavidus TaxID=106589 RepID=UPI0005798F79|nr:MULTISPECIES: hypothetical protein [Cupriavidus]KWR80325.1 hypothetical protein RN01_19005 [Cupriavidus sp. SHE]QWC87728.1 hypothetical protein KB891_11820 [Cupriavidus metallidurans]